MMNSGIVQDEGYPVPLIDPGRCDGCGLCLRACPTGALAMEAGVAIVVQPAACDYTGLCERICPRGAIQLPYEILWSPKKIDRKWAKKPTKVDEINPQALYDRSS